MDSKNKMTKVSSELSLTSIVAVGLDGAIGVENDLPWRLKSDLRFFKRTTKDNIVIMGRKTFDSIGGCLPKRDNIVLSRTPSLFPDHDNCRQAQSIGQTLHIRGKSPKKSAYVIGGAQIYAQFAPYIDRYLVTVVQSHFPAADAHLAEGIFGDDKTWIRNEIDVERIDDEGADEFEFKVIELLHRNPEKVGAAREEALNSYFQKNHILKRKLMAKRAKEGCQLGEILALA